MACTVLVCGGRHYNNEEEIFRVLNNYNADHDFTMVIEGGAQGADRGAKRWAEIGNIKHRMFVADWKKYGSAAGVIRNEEMVRIGKPDLVIAFPGGRGTLNMIETARRYGVEVVEVR